MPNALADEARQLDDAALADAVNEAYRELFNLQFQKGTHQLQDVTTIRRARRRIARLRTLLRQRELAVVAGAPIAPLAESGPAAISPQKQRALDVREAEQAARAEAESEAQADAEIPAEAVADDIADQAMEDVEIERADGDAEAQAPADATPDATPDGATEDGAPADGASADTEETD